MIIKCILILIATFITCWIYFWAMMAAVSAFQPVRIEKDKRRGPQ